MSAFAALGAALAFAVEASAQLVEPETPPTLELEAGESGGETGALVEGYGETLEERRERTFAEMRSEDPAVREAAERRMRRLIRRSGSASADLLLQRGSEAAQEQNYDAALQHLTDLVTIYPDFAEGWRARAAVRLRRQETGGALSDLLQAVTVEPRHYLALRDLGTVFASLQDPRNAYEAFRLALEVHPGFTEAREAMGRLELQARDRGA